MPDFDSFGATALDAYQESALAERAKGGVLGQKHFGTTGSDYANAGFVFASNGDAALVTPVNDTEFNTLTNFKFIRVSGLALAAKKVLTPNTTEESQSAGFMAVGGGDYYWLDGGSQLSLRRIDANGNVVWHKNYANAVTGMAANSTRVIWSDSATVFIAIDRLSGENLWRKQILSAGSMALATAAHFYGSGVRLCKLNTDGSIAAWQRLNDFNIGTPIGVVGTDVYLISATGPTVFKSDGGYASIIWQKAISGGSLIAKQCAVDGSGFYFFDTFTEGGLTKPRITKLALNDGSRVYSHKIDYSAPNDGSLSLQALFVDGAELALLFRQSKFTFGSIDGEIIRMEKDLTDNATAPGISAGALSFIGEATPTVTDLSTLTPTNGISYSVAEATDDIDDSNYTL